VADGHELPKLRMGGALRRAMGDKPNYAELARQIAALNPANSDRHLDRRKLRRIVEGCAVTLSLEELAALDEFLGPFGEGLGDVPLFSKPAPLRALAASGHVTFLLGAYARKAEQRNDVSAFDVRSMAVLLRGLEKVKPGVGVDIEDVLFDEKVGAPKVLHEPQRSVCSIGSPRACAASAAMLTKMFSGRQVTGTADPPPTVRFIWGRRDSDEPSSTFDADIAGLREIDAGLARDLERGRAWGAIQVDRGLFALRYDKQPQWPDYGLVALQRREQGRVWMVVAGLSAASTYACAVAVVEASIGSVDEGPRGVSSVRWAVVEANITRSAAPGDPRTVKAQQVIATGLLPASDA